MTTGTPNKTEHMLSTLMLHQECSMPIKSEVKKTRDFDDSTPMLKLNGDFTLLFLTLRFYPYFFCLKLPFAPGLKLRYMKPN
jgi:hypothetical protein